MPPAPPRRFAPTPIETTSRSSKQKNPIQPSEVPHSPKRRRFVPEPFDTIVRSSRDEVVSRSSTPETGDLNDLKNEHVARRESLDLAAKSAKDEQEKAKENKSKPRRFAPEPIETTRKSSKDKQKSVEKATSIFKPQLVETSRISSSDHNKSKNESNGFTSKATVRKFEPLLINTARRSRKAGDATPAINIVDKTEQGHGLAAREHRRHITGVATPMELDNPADAKHVLDLSEVADKAALRPIPSFDGAPRRTLSQNRQHSFRCPDLDTIESSESDRESDTSSTTPPDVVQGSPITASDSSFNEYRHATRTRESVDENFANYFLQLEAKRAEKRLRDQALAAFPNSDFHEPIQHYVDVEKDSDSDVSIDYRPVTYDADEDEDDDVIDPIVVSRVVRRDSTKVPWEQLEMQRHAERLDQERKANQLTHKASAKGPWWQSPYEVVQPDRELRSMRERARPPMLGGDISFPRCQSPEPARFDVTQGAAALRDQMCAERNASQSKRSADGASLWRDPMAKDDDTGSGSSKGSGSGAGLWRGFCSDAGKKSAAGLNVPNMPSGLVTPRSESLNPFENSFSLPNGVEMRGNAIQTPPPSAEMWRMPGSHTINNILNTEHAMEQTLESEFPDSFITQVYNYLSLGYPSLARPFDEELCKISHVSVADLRADDEKARASPRGYIRLGPDFEGGGGVEREESCMRWVALKRYVHEWARQEKNMIKADGPGANWASAIRRGSWGN